RISMPLLTGHLRLIAVEITECYLSGQKADTAGFLGLLFDDLESRISMQFNL
ncbi:hypothetical protein MKW98_020507, partial [Papaver atlanticum]